MKSGKSFLLKKAENNQFSAFFIWLHLNSNQAFKMTRFIKGGLSLILLLFVLMPCRAQRLFITANWCYESEAIVSVDSVQGLTPPLRYSFNNEPFTEEHTYLPGKVGPVTIVVRDANLKEAQETAMVRQSGYIGFSYDSTHATCDKEATINITELFGGIAPLNYTINNEPGNSAVDHGGNKIVVTDDAKCIAEHTVELENFCWKVYSGFSPNGDGINDTWELDELEDEFENAFVQVMNRFGQVVHRSEGPYLPWNGESVTGQELPSGTYYFQIFPLGVDHKEYEVNGFISISR